MTLTFEVSEQLLTMHKEGNPDLFVRAVEEATSDDLDYVLVDADGDVKAGMWVSGIDTREPVLGIATDKAWNEMTRAEQKAVRIFGQASIGLAVDESHGALFKGVLYDRESDVPMTEIFKLQRSMAPTVHIGGRAIREAIPHGFLSDVA